MKISLQSLVLLVMALMLPLTATAAYVQLADGVYSNGSTLYICSDVTSLGDLQVNPSEIYCYATIPPACVSNTFTDYGATLHVPAAGMVSYFTTLYWYNFNNILSDAIEPQSVTMNTAETEMEIGQQLSLSATVAPGDATPKRVYWSSTDASVATVSSGGMVTAVAIGECDILATCVDKVAVCHVTVVPPRVTITLDKHEASLLPNHTITLTATCSPVDVDLAVTSSNPDVAIPRIVNGTIMVVGVAEGTATITVNAADGYGNPDSCTVTVYTEHGDVNCDGYVNMDDLTTMINYLVTNDDTGINLTNADTNLSGGVTMDDLTTLINYLLTDKWPWQNDMTFNVNGVTFKMIYVDGGTFMMGATAEQGNDAFDEERPAHEVTLTSFRIGQTEVTQALWQAVMGTNPSYFTGDLNHPVEEVSWNDCQTFIFKLNELTGKQFRLPTEAEWEYAARGGNQSKGYKYAGSNTISDVAWYWDNIPSQNENSVGYGTQIVASKSPNELGLYDMSGNVWELCLDWFGNYSDSEQTDPVGTITGLGRVSRGGGWFDEASGCRVSNRLNDDPTGRSDNHGLRLALDSEDSNKFRLSETVVTVYVNESKSVDILNGDGGYTIEGGSDNVTCTISGNSLTVTGTNEVTTTVHISNTSTGATAVLTVIVKPKTQTFTVDGVTFKMILVEGGTFTMGATAEQGSDAHNNEYPAHEVNLLSYNIGETEVTQALWVAVMGSNPSYFTPSNGYDEDLQRPVDKVSWNDCQAFITQLNQLTGKTFRLPTEAEWEYAARGGNRSKGYKYSGSNDIDRVAWYEDNSSSVTHTVATKAPNELGLYDMSGNVEEWCQDWHGSYNSEAQTNPTGPSSGSYRESRGSSFHNSAWFCRVSYRHGIKPTYGGNYDGFRLALDCDISPMPDEHEWVDLGLPSGTLWATCNVGASSPEEYGDYYAWGETEPKEVYNWSIYKWCNGTEDTMTKYCTDSSYGYNGFTDGKTELDSEDDAACVNWGPSWRMPSMEQQRELVEQCTWSWTTWNGVNGRLVTGPNGNTMFLPAAGYRWYEDLSDVSSRGYYWSRTLISALSNCAFNLDFHSGYVYWFGDYYRINGFPVRAVRVP